MNAYQQFVQSRAALFWSVSAAKRADISEVLLVETILNYGNLEDVKQLFELLSMEKTAQIFAQHIRKKRHNYLPQVANYFTLYFKRHAPQYFVA